MKKNANYVIDFAANTVTFAAKFYDDASMDYMSEGAMLIRKFQQEGFTIARQTRKAPAKRSTGKVKKLTYQQMRDFLELLDDHAEMLVAFEKLCEAHKHDGARLKVLNDWFRSECPQYGHSTMYEWAEDGMHIVHNPNPVAAEAALISKVA